MSIEDVIVLFGGTSSERRVSVASGQNVLGALPQAKAWFLSPEGEVFICKRERVLNHARPFEVDFTLDGEGDFATVEDAFDSEDARQAVLFLALHGGEGEDGSLQGLLEARKVAFTGSGSSASARAFDKSDAKKLAVSRGVTVAPGWVLEKRGEQDLVDWLTEKLVEQKRLVLKPIADGSSVGLFHLKQAADISGVARDIVKSGVRYVAEAFIPGRELTVGVIEEKGQAVALPVSEVRVEGEGAFDYEGKYLGKGTQEITPADISGAESQAAQAMALAVHSVVGCEGYSRTDMILTQGGPVFLEINTLPGLTKASFIPQQLAASGRSLQDFLQAQIALA
ncbi:MAG: ATP-grasp domain-containing protein, partial [Myxococcaceae bacterium]|nr:ATP-grasp domain-containing protein [Myxococcaceae bacterium]